MNARSDARTHRCARMGVRASSIALVGLGVLIGIVLLAAFTGTDISPRAILATPTPNSGGPFGVLQSGDPQGHFFELAGVIVAAENQAQRITATVTVQDDRGHAWLIPNVDEFTITADRPGVYRVSVNAPGRVEWGLRFTVGRPVRVSGAVRLVAVGQGD